MKLRGKTLTWRTTPRTLRLAALPVLPLALPEVAPGLLPIVEMLPIQYFVIPLALARGFEPAAFLNAQKITTGE